MAIKVSIRAKRITSSAETFQVSAQNALNYTVKMERIGIPALLPASLGSHNVTVMVLTSALTLLSSLISSGLTKSFHLIFILRLQVIDCWLKLSLWSFDG